MIKIKARFGFDGFRLSFFIHNLCTVWIIFWCIRSLLDEHIFLRFPRREFLFWAYLLITIRVCYLPEIDITYR